MELVNTEYLAHISEDGTRKETVKQHLDEVAEMAENFARPFHGEKEARRVGMVHDLGKYAQTFQRRIRGENIPVDHSTAGASVLLAGKDALGAMAVAGHHSGLPDFGNRTDTEDDRTLIGRCKRELEDFSSFRQEIAIPPMEYPEYARKSDGFAQSFFTRMLFSCLVDADYLCTERFMEDGKAERGGCASIPELRARFDAYAEKAWNGSDTLLNAERLKIRRHCEKMAQSAPGLFRLTVPTGGGKTAASMAFALRHAEKYRKRRVIYVIPYTSIIEQNGDVLAKALGAENVLQHHSNVDFAALETETPAERNKRLSAENWDATIILTTAVQFFESLFASKPSRCRKLHNIANAVVIFDEAQMLPVQYLRPCVAAIAELAANYGVTAVMCTATQPALDSLFQEFLPGREAIELCPPDLNGEVFHRVRYSYDPEIPSDAVLAQIQREKQVLCIVNTRARAESWYNQLRGEGNYHLSTRMTPRHRRRILDIVKKRLANGLSCRVVSTSLIEAGVDVDFPVVFREIAGIDSIIQAAGRCNRNGRNPSLGAVHIFRTGEKAPALQEQNISAGESILNRVGMPDHPQAAERYFRKIYRMAGNDGMDRTQHNEPILRALQAGIGGCQLPIRTVSERFQIISEDTCTIYIPNRGNAPQLAELRQGKRNRFLLRKLGQDAVSIYRSQFQALDRAGRLEIMEPGMAILVDPEQCYSEETGMIVSAIGGDALFQ